MRPLPRTGCCEAEGPFWLCPRSPTPGRQPRDDYSRSARRIRVVGAYSAGRDAAIGLAARAAHQCAKTASPSMDRCGSSDTDSPAGRANRGSAGCRASVPNRATPLATSSTVSAVIFRGLLVVFKAAEVLNFVEYPHHYPREGLVVFIDRRLASTANTSAAAGPISPSVVSDRTDADTPWGGVQWP